MISSVTLNNVASYKTAATLTLSKKVNLLYGLNGTGKSTLSNYFYNTDNPDYSSCKHTGDGDEVFLVYNQQFINDFFYEPDDLNGIFTLSKENAEAEKEISRLAKLCNEDGAIIVTKKEERDSNESSFLKKKDAIARKVFKIKQDYAGKDRPFDFCLRDYSLIGDKHKLYSHISAVKRPTEKLEYTLTELRSELEAVNSDTSQKYDSLPVLSFQGAYLETAEILSEEIVGNDNSIVSSLIDQLQNSSWVEQGLDFLPDTIPQDGLQCPFCQSNTITQTLIDSISNFFDETYKEKKNEIENLKERYEIAIQNISNISTYLDNPFLEKYTERFQALHKALIATLKTNLSLIIAKFKSPGNAIVLTNSGEDIRTINTLITEINTHIQEHNSKIDNKADTLSDIRSKFWNLMRLEYDKHIVEMSTLIKSHTDTQKVIDSEISVAEKRKNQNTISLAIQQKKTVNVEEAIVNINTGLVDLGLSSFEIVKHDDSFYRVARGSDKDEVFTTLSEGEKMIISFLYFIEMCKGKKSTTDTANKKVVIIDDPISSLSHIFIFNVGRLIMNEFLKSDKYDQIILLTHSLYFFYEMTDIDKKRRDENQSLFRIIKDTSGSSFEPMKYESIQNDYQSYWSIIKDDKYPDALIANSMRNIVEYFFNFVEKKDLNNVFQKPSLKDVKYQSFYRYINRESHSLGQNIFDFKEFDYDIFKEAFRLLFHESGYKEHYKRMMK